MVHSTNINESSSNDKRRSPSSSYAKGRRMEYMVKKELERMGYVVFRCAASKPLDLIALKEGEALLVECKYGKKPRLGGERREEVARLAQLCGARLLLCTKGKREELRMMWIT